MIRPVVTGFFYCVLLLTLAGCGGSGPLEPLDLPDNCRQVLLVETGGWDVTTGSLRRFEREPSGGWRPAGDPIPVTVGRSGLAPGRGLHAGFSGTPPPPKVEGDGRAPAGIFSLGTAFGYAGHPPPGSRFPYRQATVRDYFVDDRDSPDYNRWIRLEEDDPGAEERWKSFERLRRPDDLYEFGIVVNHNRTPVEPGAGSAIFLHVWRGPGEPTAGCTAMSREAMIELLTWLEPERNPLLIQVPAGKRKNLETPP